MLLAGKTGAVKTQKLSTGQFSLGNVKVIPPSGSRRGRPQDAMRSPVLAREDKKVAEENGAKGIENASVGEEA